jgi:2-polyprenyl-3-methyl-5-hydroxy-6-metoxy-1,4-benzoquinol methylase
LPSNGFKELAVAVDQAKLEAFMGKFVGDLGAVAHAATIVLGDQLGLYKVLAEGPATATERFFRPGYAAHLISQWLPALEGVEEKLKSGARVADVGCGHGASTIIMAQGYRNSEFTGFDYHEPSIAHAREAARQAGLGERVRFEVASAKSYRGSDYDLVTVFDRVHDMGDPVGASAHVRESLKKDGTWMIVEPFANDQLENNLNPVGRIFYSASTFKRNPAKHAARLTPDSRRRANDSTQRRAQHA